MEVIAPEPAGDVEGFADKIEARKLLGLKGFGRDLLRGDASEGDLRRAVALRAIGIGAPGAEALGQTL